MPLPRLNYIDKTAKIKDEILANLKPMVQVDEHDVLEENSLFEDEDIKLDNINSNMNESDFIDFRILNMGDNRLSEREGGFTPIGGKHKESEKNQRMSILSDIEDTPDDRSIMLTKNMSEEYK
jgi:hypothetical protein